MNKIFTIPIRKACALAMILFTVLLPFPGNAQPISLNRKNISLVNLFVELNKQSGYDFVYDFALVETAGRVNVNVKDEPMKNVLDIVLPGKNLSYTITGNIVTITV